mmetsp:Transcript_74361/g.174537  ORF Transcript_74361/g.174537 Transcript_74361/m.174537 type:complete len:215 (+) Transcript_74361:191-835(+)
MYAGHPDGNDIGEKEEDMVDDSGGHYGYGEATFEGVEQIAAALHLDSESNFVDLGSGIGKMVIQAALQFGVKQSTGVELSPSRHCVAETIRERNVHSDVNWKFLAVQGGLARVCFVCDDIMTCPLNSATHIYVASLLFSKEFLVRLGGRLSDLSGLRRVATLQPFPGGLKGFTLRGTIDADMTWAERVPVWIYVRDDLVLSAAPVSAQCDDRKS